MSPMRSLAPDRTTYRPPRLRAPGEYRALTERPAPPTQRRPEPITAGNGKGRHRPRPVYLNMRGWIRAKLREHNRKLRERMLRGSRSNAE